MKVKNLQQTSRPDLNGYSVAYYTKKCVA